MNDTRTAMRIFYITVFGIAMVGSGQAATGWLNWWAPFAFLAVGAVEFGGAVLSMHADRRRQLGERAVWSRLLSAAVAVGAVLVNLLGHQDEPGQAAFFGGMSAVGYSVWLIDTSARRRDALRLAGKLGETAPVYGLVRWLRHPWLTRRARHLALVDPGLGLYGSLAAADAAVRAERRQRALSKVLHAKIRQAAGPAAADIAVGVYDLDQVAARLRRDADYDELTAIIAAEVTPTAVTTVRPAELAAPLGGAANEPDVEPPLPADLFPPPIPPFGVAGQLDAAAPALLADLMPAPIERSQEDLATVGQTATVDTPVYATTAIEPVQDGVDLLTHGCEDPPPIEESISGPTGHEINAKPKRALRAKKAVEPKKPGRPSVEAKVVAAFTRNPNTSVKRLARHLGVSERTIQRYRPKPVEPVTTTPNGSQPQEVTP